MPTSSAPDPHAVRFRQALFGSFAFAGLMAWVYGFQQMGDWWSGLTAQPGSFPNLALGWLSAFLHASPGHLLANAFAIVVLGTLAFGLYPRAAARALPLVTLTSFAAIWLLGQPGSHHLGASGLTYGFIGLLSGLGLLRRDRPAIAASLIVWLLFGAGWWAMVPGYPEVSWQGHLGGFSGGLLASLLWQRLDPNPFPVIQWEDEDEDLLEYPASLSGVPAFSPTASCPRPLAPGCIEAAARH